MARGAASPQSRPSGRSATPAFSSEASRGWPLLEEHTGGLPGNLQRMDESRKPARKQAELRRPQAAEARDQPLLRGLRRPSSKGSPRGRQRDLDAARVLLGRPPNHEPSLLEAGQDHRNRALIGERACGEVVDGRRRCLHELLQDEELGSADPEATLGSAGRDAERADDPAERVHHGDHVGLSGRLDGGSVTSAHRPSLFRLDWSPYITETVGSTVQREGPAGHTVRARLTRSAAPRSDPAAPPGAPGRSRRRCRSRPRPGRPRRRPARRGASATPPGAR